MKLEITSEQFDKIQNEIIRLENRIADEGDKMTGWESVHIIDQIFLLKEILANEEIELK